MSKEKQEPTKLESTATTLTNNLPAFALKGETITWGIQAIYLTITEYPMTDNTVLSWANKSNPIDFRKVVDKASVKSGAEWLNAVKELIGENGEVEFDKDSFLLDENGKHTKVLTSAKIKINFKSFCKLITFTGGKVVTVTSTNKKIDQMIKAGIAIGFTDKQIAQLEAMRIKETEKE